MWFLPKGWRVYEGHDPEKELKEIQDRFRSVREHADGQKKHRSLAKVAAFTFLIVFGCSVACLAVAESVSATEIDWSPVHEFIGRTYLRLTFTDRDCRDFADQAEAQEFFLSAGPGDPHWLDDDNDGRACEALP